MKKVFVYTDSSCINCVTLKRYLTLKNIAFTEICIDDAPSKIRSMNSVPVLVSGEVIVRGLNVLQINNALGITDCINENVYLDNAATTRIFAEVFKEMQPYIMNNFANASSSYSIGLANNTKLHEVQSNIANLLNCKHSEILFTSGGSESNNMALKGIAFANVHRGNHIITSSIEHPSVLNTCKWLETQGFNVTYLPVDEHGLVSTDDLEGNITNKTILISIMHVNNEIGTIQDIVKIGELAKKHQIYFHTDAVQSIGKLTLDLLIQNVDLLSFSGHKFNGPKGIGVLYVKEGTNIDPLIHGVSQQGGLRSGTENLASIVALGKALEMNIRNINKNRKYLRNLTELFTTKLRVVDPGLRVNGHPENKFEGNVNICFSEIDSTTLKFLLDACNIYISSGSACSESNLKPSHVLKAIGLSDEECSRSVRFTFGVDNTKEDIEYVSTVISEISRLIQL